MVDLFNRGRASPEVPQRRGFGGTLMVWSDNFFRYLRHIGKKPVPVQIGAGAAGGWVLGYFFTKGSKFCALLGGCLLIIVQFMNYRGYLKFHRHQIQQDIDDISDQIKIQLGVRGSGLPNGRELDDFINKNSFFLSGFIAGNLIGYGMA